MTKSNKYDPTRARTGIIRLGGGCPIQLCYGASTRTIFSCLVLLVKVGLSFVVVAYGAFPSVWNVYFYVSFLRSVQQVRPAG